MTDRATKALLPPGLGPSATRGECSSRRSELCPATVSATSRETPGHVYSRPSRMGGHVSGLRALGVLALLALVVPLSADADIAAVQVRNSTQFAAAVAALRDTGGTIELRRNDYGGELVVGTRSARPLHIVGERGVRVESLLLERTQHVSVSRITIAPIRDDAWLRISGSRHIELRDLLVTAKRTRYRATVQIIGSRHVTIRRSEFRHCGDRSPLFSNCLHLKHGTRHVRILDNWFHDCRGCDFVHGLFGYDLTLRGNRFERALPCRMDQRALRAPGPRVVLVGQPPARRTELVRRLPARRGAALPHPWSGQGFDRQQRVSRYRPQGAGLSGARRDHRREQGIEARPTPRAHREQHDPHGCPPHRRLRGLDPDERRLLGPTAAEATTPREQRHRSRPGSAPRLQRRSEGDRERGAARSCVPWPNRVGPVHLDPHGRPTAASTLLIDRGSRGFGTRRDIDGRPRDLRPDIGAYEYRGPKRTS